VLSARAIVDYSEPGRVKGQVPDAVIVAAARSPIGRAVKGSLRAMRADDMAVAMIRAALSRVPR